MPFRFLCALGLLMLGGPPLLAAQDRRDEQFYYPGSFNWRFLKVYPEAARLFNAFDYGHAILYEKLYTKQGAEREAALEKAYQYLTTDLLVRPPRFAVAEEAVEPAYAKLAWQAKQMFDWAHVLHRQIYDIYSDERLTPVARDSLIERVTDYYLSRTDYAFTTVPKSMALMDEQYFSQVFRKAHPKFNGLIWSYHWLQVGLYEPLILGTTSAEKKAGVKATLARFWTMLQDPPKHFPVNMPMTSGIAPTFSAKHPRAAVIFDNLHTMHDIISDVLAADTVPRDRKRAVIYQQLAEFRDGTRNVMSMEEWGSMTEMMGGIGRMGGAATGLLVRSGMDTTSGHQHEAKQAPPDTVVRPHRHPGGPPAKEDSDSGEVVAVVQRFDSLMAAGDSTGILALLADDAVILESGGLENRAEFRSHHLPADISFARSVKSTPGPIMVRVLGDVAWASSTTTLEGEMRGRVINSVSAELMVLSRESGVWRIRAIHWSSRARRTSGT